MKMHHCNGTHRGVAHLVFHAELECEEIRESGVRMPSDGHQEGISEVKLTQQGAEIWKLPVRVQQILHRFVRELFLQSIFIASPQRKRCSVLTCFTTFLSWVKSMVDV
jgi:hypothetical protein